MATGAGILELFDAIIENSELVIQLSWEAHHPGLINQATAELYKNFAAYGTALAQMIEQGRKMISLPQGEKLEKLKSFIGVIDIDAVNAFIF